MEDGQAEIMDAEAFIRAVLSGRDDFKGIVIRGDVDFSSGTFLRDRKIDLSGATIHGTFGFADSRLPGLELSLSGADLRGEVYFVRIKGPVRRIDLQSAKLSGDITFEALSAETVTMASATINGLVSVLAEVEFDHLVLNSARVSELQFIDFRAREVDLDRLVVTKRRVEVIGSLPLAAAFFLQLGKGVSVDYGSLVSLFGTKATARKKKKTSS